MSSSSTNMATPGYCQSMYLAAPRPNYCRQRSNSLPAGFRSIRPEEAGLMISAAERATARRRRIVSVDTPLGMNSSIENTVHSKSSPEISRAIKPSPLRQVTQVRSPPPRRHVSTSRALRDLDANQVINGRSISPSTDFLLKALPISPISPTKRQVTTHSLKNYADNLFQFTQNALVSTIPHMASPPQTPNIFEDVFAGEPASSQPSHSQRPSLESKFSDWSIATGNPDSRRSSVAEPITPPMELEPSLMSPDSFFGGFEATPRRNNFLRDSEASGYASSETYEAPAGIPLTPPPQSTKDEFSYFQNFDQYLDRSQQPESLEIKLSPIEVLESPVTPPPAVRRRADTVIRAPVIARSCSGPPLSRFAHSSPNTPFRMGEPIPNWLVGPIG